MDDIKITELQRINIKPNDVLIYKTDKCLSKEGHYHINDRLKSFLQESGINNKIIVIDNGDALYSMGTDDFEQENRCKTVK